MALWKLSDKKKVRDALERISEKCGGQGALSERLGLDRTTVNKWMFRGRVPTDRIVELSKLGEPEVTLTPGQWTPRAFGMAVSP